MLRNRLWWTTLSMALAVVSPRLASAGLVVASFNDVTTGTLSGKAGGTGLTGLWNLSNNPQVVAGNLTSSLYSLTQSGTAQSVQTTAGGVAGGDSVSRRAITAPLQNTIWFTFLGQLVNNTNRAALNLNPTGPSIDSDDVDFIFVGDGGAGATGQFRVRIGLNTSTIASNLSQNGTATNLVLGQIIINSSGTFDTLNVWLNPNLTTITGPGGLPMPGFTSSTTHWVTGSQISNIGVGSYGSTNGGKIDAIRISDSATAFKDVTGVPEPSSLTLALIGVMGMLAARRRQK